MMLASVALPLVEFELKLRTKFVGTEAEVGMGRQHREGACGMDTA